MGEVEPPRTKRGVNVADVVGGGLIIAVGAFFFINALSFGVFGEGGRLAPGAMPFFSGVFLALCGLAIAINGLRDSEAVESTDAEVGTGDLDNDRDRVETDDDGRGPDEIDDGGHDRAATEDEDEESHGSEVEERVGRSLAVLGIAAMATWFASRIGFLLAFALMVFGLLVALERERVWRAALVAGATFAFAWVVFDFFLNIPLPETFSFWF